MKIRNVAHKGLRQFIERDRTSGLPAVYVEKIRNILTFLQEMADIDELESVPTWKAHKLTGDRRGTWSLTGTRNWRITFSIADEEEIVDLDFEDYH